MKYVYFLIVFFIFALFQSTFFASPVRPDFILILIICVSTFEEETNALLLSLLAGAAEGIFFPDIICFYMFSAVAVSFLIILLKKKVFYENIPLLFPVVLCLFFTASCELMYYAFSALYDCALFYLFEGIIYRLIINAILILPVCFLYDRLFVRQDKLKFYKM